MLAVRYLQAYNNYMNNKKAPHSVEALNGAKLTTAEAVRTLDKFIIRL